MGAERALKRSSAWVTAGFFSKHGSNGLTWPAKFV
jgi:hypothetical protein